MPYQIETMKDSTTIKAMRQLDGVLVLNKPVGPTSTHCLNIIKRMGQKKIGHAGTLDPMAGGVLLVLLGQATKLSSWLLGAGTKIYVGEACLGVETDTWDATGAVMAEKPPHGLDEALIGAQIKAWKELSLQEVPPYSAAKYRGKPLYHYARRGMEAPKKIKNIKIHAADMLGWEQPIARFRVVCDSGAYIRSLAHSLGERLGCGASLCGLVREYSHPFGLDEAVDLESIIEDPAILERNVRPLEDALPQWPRVELDEMDLRKVKNGIAIRAAANTAKNAFLCRNGKARALATLTAGERGLVWKVSRGLWN